MGWFGLSHEEMFPEEAEEEQRINGRFKKFKSPEEISDEDVRHIQDISDDLLDTDNINSENEYWDLISRFGDGEHEILIFFIDSKDKVPEPGQETPRIMGIGKTKKDYPCHRFWNDSHGKRGRRYIQKKQFRQTIRNNLLST